MIGHSFSSDALFHEPFCGVLSGSLNRCVKCILSDYDMIHSPSFCDDFHCDSFPVDWTRRR